MKKYRAGDVIKWKALTVGVLHIFEEEIEIKWWHHCSRNSFIKTAKSDGFFLDSASTWIKRNDEDIEILFNIHDFVLKNILKEEA